MHICLLPIVTGRNVLAACLAMHLSFGIVAAQDPDNACKSAPEESVDVARKFAPILWFATDEPFWPTLPHPFLFDGFDNGGNAEIDLQDATEVALGMPNQDQLVSMRYLQSLSCRSRPPMVVFFEGPTKFGKHGGRDVYVIQYWMYYLHDNGVNGHGGDSEHVFVFVVDDNPLLRIEDPNRYSQVAAIVGAGHLPQTANNILAATTPGGPLEVIGPRHIPHHIPVLVELGKHASAPDRNVNGRFDRGMDANIFRDAAWGSRDVHTGSIGKLTGRFRDWYSFPRVPSRLAFEETFDRRAPEYDEVLRELRGVPSCDSSPADCVRAFSSNVRYRLVPLSAWSEVACALKSERGRHAVSSILTRHKDALWGIAAPTPLCGSSTSVCTVCVSTPASAAKWQRPQDGDLLSLETYTALRESVVLEWDTGHHIKLFRHDDHRDPKKIFKLHLFPRFSAGLSYDWSGSVDKGTGRLSVWFADWRLSWLRFIKIGGAPHLNDSAIELFCGLRTQLEYCGFNYEFFRGEVTGFYGGGVMRLSEMEGPGGTKEKLGGEAGLALAWYARRRAFVDTKIGVRFEPWRSGNANEKWSLHVTAGLRFGLKGARHPLEY